ncbi:MAG: DUF4157 domain-containing protein [Chitinophagaceae bacterium]
MQCHIKERSFIARIAAWKLGASGAAIVIGKTIHLHNASKEEFMSNPRWFRHEVAHLIQFKEHGHLGFIFKYLFESVTKGYKNNKFEIAARAAESQISMSRAVEIINK